MNDHHVIILILFIFFAIASIGLFGMAVIALEDLRLPADD